MGKHRKFMRLCRKRMPETIMKLKKTILRWYNITEESYRQRFRSVKKEKEESNRELVMRLEDLATRCLRHTSLRMN